MLVKLGVHHVPVSNVGQDGIGKVRTRDPGTGDEFYIAMKKASSVAFC